MRVEREEAEHLPQPTSLSLNPLLINEKVGHRLGEQDQKVYRCDIWNLENLWDLLIVYSSTSHLNVCYMFYILFKVYLDAHLMVIYKSF